MISLAPLGMISQQGEPGSTGTLAERQGRRSEREREMRREGLFMRKRDRARGKPKEHAW